MHRRALRDAVRSALALDTRFAGFTDMRSWAQGVDEDALPVYGVATPDEKSERVTFDMTGRRVDLEIAVKRRGGDELDDDLDADAAAIEAVVEAALTALPGVAINWHLLGTRMGLSGSAGSRAGAVMLTFSVLVHTTP